MNLFIDTLSKVNVLIEFDEERNILNKYEFDVKLNESTRLIEEIDGFLKQINKSYSDIENFVVVNWPGSFTWIRTLVILINTINFVIKKNLTSLTYFDLFDTYPIIKASSKKDSFIKFWKNEEINILQNDEILNLLKNSDTKKINSCSIIEWFEVNLVPDYEKIIKNLKLDTKKIIQPFYLKKPNIS